MTNNVTAPRSIEIERYTPQFDGHGNKTGYLEYAGQRPVAEIESEIRQVLKIAPGVDASSPVAGDGSSTSLWDELEYLHATSRFEGEGVVFPRCRWVEVSVVRGGSEGYYIHVTASGLYVDPSKGSTWKGGACTMILLGKAFSIDVALQTANVVTRLFHGS